MKKPIPTPADAPALNKPDSDEAKRLAKIARYRAVYSARMLPALARELIDPTRPNRAIAEVPLPPLTGTKKRDGFHVGDRLFYREFNGGYTGRAELLTILEFTREGNGALVWRSWAWSQGKETDDLAELSLRVDADCLLADGMPPLVGS